MKKLHLSVISLGLCLILGSGDLAAQGKGKGKNNNKTTFEVFLHSVCTADVMGQGFCNVLDARFGSGLVVLGGAPGVFSQDCPGLSDGSTITAQFRNLDCMKITGQIAAGNDVMLSLYQMTPSIKQNEWTMQMWFRPTFGDRRGGYLTGSFPVTVLGNPFSGNMFTIVVRQTLTLTKSNQPGRGSVGFDIVVGDVDYIPVIEP